MVKTELASLITDPNGVPFCKERLSPRASALANQLDLVNLSWAPPRVGEVLRLVDGIERCSPDKLKSIDLSPLKGLLLSRLKTLGAEYFDQGGRIKILAAHGKSSFSELAFNQHEYFFSLSGHPALAFFESNRAHGGIALSWSMLASNGPPPHVDHEERHAKNHQLGLVQSRLRIELA